VNADDLGMILRHPAAEVEAKRLGMQIVRSACTRPTISMPPLPR
jgi:hypothetical protein